MLGPKPITCSFIYSFQIHIGAVADGGEYSQWKTLQKKNIMGGVYGNQSGCFVPICIADMADEQAHISDSVPQQLNTATDVCTRNHDIIVHHFTDCKQTLSRCVLNAANHMMPYAPTYLCHFSTRPHGLNCRCHIRHSSSWLLRVHQDSKFKELLHNLISCHCVCGVCSFKQKVVFCCLG